MPLVEALDGKGEPAGEGMALYTFRDRKGAILGCTMQFAGGFTEQEQAELLQTLYLSYLANGIDRLYFYDFHSDGRKPGRTGEQLRHRPLELRTEAGPTSPTGDDRRARRAPKFAGRVEGVPEHVQALLFDRPKAAECSPPVDRETAPVRIRRESCRSRNEGLLHGTLTPCPVPPDRRVRDGTRVPRRKRSGLSPMQRRMNRQK